MLRAHPPPLHVSCLHVSRLKHGPPQDSSRTHPGPHFYAFLAPPPPQLQQLPRLPRAARHHRKHAHLSFVSIRAVRGHCQTNPRRATPAPSASPLRVPPCSLWPSKLRNEPTFVLSSCHRASIVAVPRAPARRRNLPGVPPLRRISRFSGVVALRRTATRSVSAFGEFFRVAVVCRNGHLPRSVIIYPMTFHAAVAASRHVAV